MLIVTFHNDGSGSGGEAHYNWRVYINSNLLDIGRIEHHVRDQGWRKLFTLLGKQKEDTSDEHRSDVLRAAANDDLLAHMRRGFAPMVQGWTNAPTFFVAAELVVRQRYWFNWALGAWTRTNAAQDRSEASRALVADELHRSFTADKLPRFPEGTLQMYDRLLAIAVEQVNWNELADSLLENIEGYQRPPQ